MNDAEPTIGSEEDGRARDAHLYYGWLSDVWSNLYAICGDCRPKRTTYFPVDGQRAHIPTSEEYARFVDQGDGTWPDLILDETPLLVDPCADDIARHLVPRDDVQVTEGITANIFNIINSLAMEAIESGRERITDEAIEKWEPEFDADAAFA